MAGVLPDRCAYPATTSQGHGDVGRKILARRRIAYTDRSVEAHRRCAWRALYKEGVLPRTSGAQRLARLMQMRDRARTDEITPFNNGYHLPEGVPCHA